ncbi:hypothetical protein QE370_000465 [Aeromicrobium sp. SORGH_AS981]|uniref:hypothetical protein n=1 Tax=Aeromicrobium sp. SORGH_AS_0981 TaxID=3041802 RepID=UPI00286258E5|nr:hypothetical protein [Aeromicrobium sp. SORGH_AS_0981]MDR6117281.1 hypothetical protein [Aeromicrobium sp. SORGH_AS_0981]
MSTDLYVLRDGRHPVVLGILVFLALVSLYSLVIDPPSRNIDLAFDYPQRAIWSAQVLTAALVTLTGLHLKDRILGALVERVGWGLMVVGVGTYLTILATYSTWSAAGIVFAISAGVVVGSALRIRQITRDLHDLRRTSRALDA